MNTTAQAILGTALPLAVPLLLAAAELFALRRGRGGPEWDDYRPPAPPVAPVASGGQKPLPDCLVPKLRAKPRVRILEPV